MRIGGGGAVVGAQRLVDAELARRTDCRVDLALVNIFAERVGSDNRLPSSTAGACCRQKVCCDLTCGGGVVASRRTDAKRIGSSCASIASNRVDTNSVAGRWHARAIVRLFHTLVYIFAFVIRIRFESGVADALGRH